MSKKQKPKLHCLKDRILLNIYENVEMQIPGNSEASKINIYNCPKCKRLYTSISEYRDCERIDIQGFSVVNILPADDARRNYSPNLLEISPGNKCYVFYKSNRTSKCFECKSTLSEQRIRWVTPQKLIGSYVVLRCRECKTFYLEIETYLEHEEEWVPINEKDVLTYKETMKMFGRPPSKHTLKQLRKLQDKKEKMDVQRSYNEKNSIKQIKAHDFIVRATVLKCRNQKHNIQDIQAIITSIGKHGTANRIRISAGYCPECNMYFIMESIYKKIRRTGIPICRTMDEKTYRKEDPINRKISPYNALAQESVLKQFGYNVNQTDDLTADQRESILAAIVDYNVLTKSEIISYLEYFINNRKNQKNPDGSQKYRIAISKWTEDRKYISEYKTGTFKKVNVARVITYK